MSTLNAHYRRRVRAALRTVLCWTITDAFDLLGDESAYLSLVLGDVLDLDVEVLALPLAVREEIRDGLYSGRLAARHASVPRPRPASSDVLSADLGEWLHALMDTVTTTLALGSASAVQIQARLSDVLLDLGIGYPTSPRASRYLPLAVRHVLTSA